MEEHHKGIFRLERGHSQIGYRLNNPLHPCCSTYRLIFAFFGPTMTSYNEAVADMIAIYGAVLRVRTNESLCLWFPS